MLESLGIPVATWMLPIIGAVVSALLIWGGRKLLKKFNVDNQQLDEMLTKYVKIGVDYAERFAENKLAAQGEKVPSTDKLSLATKTVLAELDKAGITKVGEQLIQARIESWLTDKDAAEGKSG